MSESTKIVALKELHAAQLLLVEKNNKALEVLKKDASLEELDETSLEEAKSQTLEELRGAKQLLKYQEVVLLEEVLTRRYNDGELRKIKNTLLENFFHHAKYTKLIHLPDTTFNTADDTVRLREEVEVAEVIEELKKGALECFSPEDQATLALITPEVELAEQSL